MGREEGRMNEAFRMSAISVIDELIDKKVKQQERLILLKNYMSANPPPKEVEELIWSLLVSHNGGYCL